MLTFITGNTGKAKYLSDYFNLPVEHQKLDLVEIQSLDLEGIVKDKAKRAYELVQKPVLVEDVSLVFKSLNNLPGPLIKWFAESLGNDGLCRLLDNQDRSAIASVIFALADSSGIKVFSGKTEGRIADQPRGDQGFGWDPIFIPEGFDDTWAEMSADDKHNTSMRKMPLEELKKYLKNQ